MTVTGPPDDYTDHLKEAAHEVLSMTDIVERLRDHKNYSPLHREAADIIERLRALAAIVREQGLEIEQMRAQLNEGADGYAETDNQVKVLQAENERLRAALQEIAQFGGAEDTMATIARRALEPKP